MPDAEFTEAELVAWGEEFGRHIAYPAYVALHGELGAGKTTLVRAIARAQGSLEPITSQSYGIVREYASSRGHVFHLDLYRLAGPQGLPQIGWDDIMRMRKALVLIEWPERAEGHLPPEHVELRLEYVPGRDDVRRLTW